MGEPLEFEVCVSGDKLDVAWRGMEIKDIPWKLDQVRLETVKVLNAFTSSGVVQGSFETRVLGANLYELLFSPNDQHFLTAFKEAKKERCKLRVALRFAADSGALPHLPWEFLCVPPGRWDSHPAGFFVAAHTDLILYRQISSTGRYQVQRPRSSSVAQQELRILLVVSSPDDLETVDTTDLVKLLQSWQDESDIDEVAALSNRTVVFKELLNPTKQVLADKVREEPGWDIVHFCGHGRFGHQLDADRVSGGEVALQSGGNLWVGDETFAQTVGNDMTELVFMQSCESASSDEGRFGGFCGLAPVLISYGVPSVIAMQYAIKNSDANRFALKFYQSLRAGDTVDRAVQNGRMALATDRDTENFFTRDFGSPVVYVGRTGMSFFDPPNPAYDGPRTQGRGPGRAAAQGLPTMGGMTAQRALGDRRGAVPMGWEPCPTGCSAWLPVDARLCNACGTKLKRCPQPLCGRLNDASWTHCQYCADPIQPATGSSAGLDAQG